MWAKQYGRYFGDFEGFRFSSIEELNDTDLIVSGNTIIGSEDNDFNAVVAPSRQFWKHKSG